MKHINKQQGLAVGVVIAIVALLAIGGGAAYVASQNNASFDLGTNGNLSVSGSQSGETTLAVDSATLKEDGFLVVRNGDDTVIGASALLSAGTHTDITIALNQSLAAGEDVTVTVISDENESGSFEAESDTKAEAHVDITVEAGAGAESEVEMEDEKEEKTETEHDEKGGLEIEVDGETDINLY